MKTLKSIQYLRAIAALLVVYCHAIDCQIQFGTSTQQKFYYLENFGAIGVDIFFIISGFIISYITATASKQLTIKEFLKRRFIRIVPIYYLVTAILFIIFLFNSAYHVEYSSVLKSLTILPVFDSGISFWYPILFIGWTLSFEWFFIFYIVYF
jgi:peptidoglycan/LPS O-acetylase OafA/YrhL